MRAALGLVEALVQRPDEITAADIAPLREAGIPDADIENAIAVCSLFSMIVRVADALGFEVPPAEAFEKSAGLLLRTGLPVAGRAGNLGVRTAMSTRRAAP